MDGAVVSRRRLPAWPAVALMLLTTLVVVDLAAASARGSVATAAASASHPPGGSRWRGRPRQARRTDPQL